MAETQPKKPKPAARGQSEAAPTAGGSLLAAAALIVALASAATAGWLWWQQNQSRGAQADLAGVQARELAELEAQIDQIRQNLTAVDHLGDVVGSTTEQLGADLSEVRSELGRIREQLVDRLSDDDHQRRTGFALSEAESLMRIAGYQLSLRRDPVTALEALNLADQLLAGINEPLVVPVRDTLAREIQALESIPHPDVPGASARLAALAEQSDTLPLRTPDTEAAPETDEAAPDTETGEAESAETERSTWAALMKSMGRSLSQLVRVQKHDEDTTVLLLSPDEERLLRNNLRLKFETARLAMLERRTPVYQGTLSEAHDWLNAYFDETDPVVAQALEQAAALAALNPDPPLPDVSGSLRQLQTVRDSLAQAGAAQ